MRVDGTTQSLQLGLSNASADPVRLNRLLAERIETIEPGFGIEAFTLSATETAPLDAPANRDWLTPATDPTGLPALLERLMGRVGIQSLSRLQTGASQFPEREQAYTQEKNDGKHLFSVIYPQHPTLAYICARSMYRPLYGR
jgi:protein ImuB